MNLELEHLSKDLYNQASDAHSDHDKRRLQIRVGRLWLSLDHDFFKNLLYVI